MIIGSNLSCARCFAAAPLVAGFMVVNVFSKDVKNIQQVLGVLATWRSINQSINQSKRKTSYANGQTNLGHKHKAPDHNHEATQPMVDLPHTS